MTRRRRTKEKYERGKTRRSDEENLYYIIERDLERETLFPWNDGWIPQAKVTKKGRKTIDYVVQYDKDLIGIEVKFDFPRVNDFEQVQEYREAGTLNGIFVAYPSDRVGEAVKLIEKEDLKEFGLISIALFHSHVISKAQLFRRQDDYLFDEYFDKRKKEQEIKDDYDKEVWWLEEDILFGKSKKPYRSPYRYRNEGATIALFLKLHEIYGYPKYFQIDGNNRLWNNKEPIDKLGFGPRIRDEALGYFFDRIDYGTLLSVYSPTQFLLYNRAKILNKIKNKFPEDYENITNFIKGLKSKKRERQKSWRGHLFE